MPGAWAHSFYWAGSADAPPAAASSAPSYSRWMTTITVPCATGSLGAQVFQAIYDQWRPSRTTTHTVSHGDH